MPIPDVAWPLRKRPSNYLQQWSTDAPPPPLQLCSGQQSLYTADALPPEWHVDLSDFDWNTALDSSLFDFDDLPPTTAAALSAPVPSATGASSTSSPWDNDASLDASVPSLPANPSLSPQPRTLDSSHAGSNGSLFTVFDVGPRPASISTSASNHPSHSATGTNAATNSPTSTLDSQPESTRRTDKRKRNTEAARRYRKRKLDKVSDLEDALDEVTKERDELRMKLARAEAEAAVLRSLVVDKTR